MHIVIQLFPLKSHFLQVRMQQASIEIPKVETNDSTRHTDFPPGIVQLYLMVMADVSVSC